MATAERKDETWIRWWLAPSRRFVPLFLILLAVFNTAIGWIPEGAMSWFLEATTGLDRVLMNAFYEDVSQNGTTLSMGGFSVQVVEECTGLFESAILVAAILAYQATAREKLQGALIGVAALYSVNLFRIASLVVVGRYAPDAFEFAHLYFWQAALIVLITAGWLAWIHFGVDVRVPAEAKDSEPLSSRSPNPTRSEAESSSHSED